ncbi:MAG: class I SAM-dependent methyltransferase [Gammaproteobacteria bacterium]|nr:class I SAM-dependent methyltransferase [Gammaproteobacteria bacterium]
MDQLTASKWDRAAKSFDLMNGVGSELRWGAAKKNLFADMQGRILFLAVGTGLDIQYFPPGQQIIGIDISGEMIARATPRAEAYPGKMQVTQMDVHELPYPDAHFDQIYTSCTFCSVPEPVKGLQALHRVLKPGGTLGMFEHTGSGLFPFNLMLHLMTSLSRALGPEMNRPTVVNVQQAGFEVTSITNHYLDVVRSIRAVKGALISPPQHGS